MAETTSVDSSVPVSQADKRTQLFRISWLRLYATMAVLGGLVSLVRVVPLSQGMPTRESYWEILFACLVYELIASAALTMFCTVRLNPDGLRGQNLWGIRCTMSWEEIASATPSRMLGLPWLIVRSHRTQNAIWLPLFLADKRGFQEAITQLAPPTCPLSSLMLRVP